MALLLFASTYPEYLYPADPYGVQRMQYSNENNTSQIITPPIPPNKDYPWGTDERGRDMKSLIIYGTKKTVFVACLAALLRLFIALPLSILAGYKNKFAAWLIKLFNILFSAIPLVIAVIIFSSIGIFNFIIKDNTLRSVVWLVLLGWSRLSYLLAEKVSEILQQDFIEGEIAIGKNKVELAVQNILPHLIPSIVVMYFLEVAMILLLMSQIGIFGAVLGGGFYNAEGGLAVPNEFDWASLLQFAYLLFGSEKMWLVTFPAAAFAVSVIGFNLFGEGLRIEFEKRSSKVITFIKRIPDFFSIPKLLYEIKSYQQNKRRLIFKAITYIVILTILVSPPIPSRYKFDGDNSIAIVKELSDPKYQGRRTGSEGMRKTAEYIADTLKSYGVRPLGEDYVQSYTVPKAYNISYGEFKVYTASGKEIEFENRNDYYIISPYNQSQRAKIIKARPEELKSVNMEKFEEFHNSIILMDVRYADPRDVTSAMMNLSFIIKPKGVIMIQGWQSLDDYPKVNIVDKTFQNTLVINLSSDKGDQLLAYKDLEAEYKVETIKYENARGYNVIGYIPGSNPKYANECIVVGTAIDYLGNDKNLNYPGALSLNAIAAELEIARVMSKYGIKPEKTIIFGFWDGSFTDYRGSRAFKESHIAKNGIKTYYIELAEMASTKTKKLMLDTSKSVPKSKLSQSYIRAFKNVARKKEVPVAYGRLTTASTEDFMGIEKEALVFGSDGINDFRATPKDNLQAVNAKELDRFGQVILDTIIKISTLKK